MNDTRNELEQIINRIAWCCDHEEGRGASVFFTEDAVMQLNGEIFARGRESIDRIHRFNEGTELTARHIYANFLLLEETPQSAKAANVVIAFLAYGPGPHPATPAIVADITYEFVRESGGAWRIANHSARFSFGGPPTKPAPTS